MDLKKTHLITKEKFRTIESIPVKFISELTFHDPTPFLDMIKLQKHPFGMFVVDEWRIVLHHGGPAGKTTAVRQVVVERNSHGAIVDYWQRTAAKNIPEAWMKLEEACVILNDVYGIDPTRY